MCTQVTKCTTDPVAVSRLHTPIALEITHRLLTYIVIITNIITKWLKVTTHFHDVVSRSVRQHFDKSLIAERRHPHVHLFSLKQTADLTAPFYLSS